MPDQMPDAPDLIQLRGLRVVGICGVLPEERERPQPFEIDLDVEIDLAAAGTSDDLADTLDYGALAESVVEVVADRAAASCSNGWPRRIAEMVLADDRVQAVTVTVRKLRPPVPIDLDTSGVRVCEGPADVRAFLGLGSNLGDRQAYLREAVVVADRRGRRSRPSTRPIRSAAPTGRAPTSTSWSSSTPTCRPASCSGSATGSSRRPTGCARSAGARARSTSTSSGPTPGPIDEPDLADPASAHVRAALRDGAAGRPGARRRAGRTGPTGPRAGCARSGRCSGPADRPDRRRPSRVDRCRAGPGRSLAAALAAARVGRWRVDRPLGRADDASGAAGAASTSLRRRHPRRGHRRRWPRRSSRSTRRRGGPPGRLARARRARAAPAAGGAASAGGHARPRQSGARGCAAGAWFAVAGDPMARRVVDDLGGRCVRGGRRRPGRLSRRRGDRLEPPRRRCSARSSGSRPRPACRSRPTSSWCGRRSTTSPTLGPAAALTGPAARGD